MAGAEPPDVPKDREETKHSDWFQMLLARFNPISGSATNNTVLDFEKPLFDLDNKILEVRRGGLVQPPGLAPPLAASDRAWLGEGGRGVAGGGAGRACLPGARSQVVCQGSRPGMKVVALA